MVYIAHGPPKSSVKELSLPKSGSFRIGVSGSFWELRLPAITPTHSALCWGASVAVFGDLRLGNSLLVGVVP